MLHMRISGLIPLCQRVVNLDCVEFALFRPAIIARVERPEEENDRGRVSEIQG